MVFPETLRHCRETVGLSARELSGLAGLNVGVVALLENGRREYPTTPTLQSLASVLGTTLDWLWRGIGEPPTKEEMVAAVERARAASGTGDAA